MNNMYDFLNDLYNLFFKIKILILLTNKIYGYKL